MIDKNYILQIEIMTSFVVYLSQNRVILIQHVDGHLLRLI